MEIYLPGVSGTNVILPPPLRNWQSFRPPGGGRPEEPRGIFCNKKSKYVSSKFTCYLYSSVHEGHGVEESGPRLVVRVVQHILADISVNPLKQVKRLELHG